MASSWDESGIHALAGGCLAPPLLVIDDDPLVRRSLVRALRRRYTVIEASTAEMALARLKAGERFTGILCDLHLSGMSGRQFLLEVEALDHEQAAAVVILSGSPRNAMDDAFLEIVATRFLEKPAGLPEIEQVLARIAASRVAA